MANATGKVQSSSVEWGDDCITRPLINTAQTWYPGSMVAVDSSDYAVKCDDTAGIQFDGINYESVRIVVPSGESSGDREIKVGRPWRFVMSIAAAAAGDVGLAVYAKYDNEVAYAAGATNDILVGWVDKVLSATSVLINPIYGPLTNLSVANNTLTFAGTTGSNTIVMPDNLADALSFVEGATPYLTFITTNSGERVQLKKQTLLGDSVKLAFGDADDLTVNWDGTDLLVAQAAADSIVKWGVSGAGINHIFYGDTATYNLTWDQTNDQLLFNDNAKLSIGSGAGSAGDISVSWDATRLNVTQLTTNSEIRWGVDGAGIDQRFYGDTASAAAVWDQSADALVFEGVSGITNLKVKQSTAVAITGATTLVLADSGGHFTVSQAAAYDIDLPSPTTGAGATYFFHLTAPGANNVTLTVAGSAATFVGSITIDGATIVATGSTLTFATGASSLGDSIMVRSLATNLYHVVCISSTSGGITIA